MTSSIVTSGAGREMIGAGARADQRAGQVPAPRRALRRISSQRGRPVEPHAALRGVHRLGDAEAERPEVPAEGDRRVPVDRGVEPGVAVGQRIGHDMRGRVGDAVERLLRPRGNCCGGRVRVGRRACRRRSGD